MYKPYAAIRIPRRINEKHRPPTTTTHHHHHRIVYCQTGSLGLKHFTFYSGRQAAAWNDEGK